jgi:aspartokinase-like uncharacterized kinase
MSIAERLLLSYVREVARHFPMTNHTPHVFACMLLERLGTDMADTASSKQCDEIFRIIRAAKDDLSGRTIPPARPALMP